MIGKSARLELKGQWMRINAKSKNNESGQWMRINA